MSLNSPTLDMIDARVAAGQSQERSMGTMTTRISATRVAVIFDGSAMAVPVKMFSDVTAVEGDRVGLVKYGTDWVVVGCFTTILNLGVIGGNKWVGGGNLVTGLVGTEVVIMSTPTLTMPANSLVEITGNMYLLDTGSSGNVYAFRIRDGNTTGGTQRGAVLWKSPDTTFGYNQPISATHEIGTSAVVQQYCITAQRVSATTGQLTMIAGNDTQNVYLRASVIGAAGRMTSQPTP